MFEKAPDPGWIPIIRGFLIAYGLTLLTVLAGIIAVCKVNKDTSYGFELVMAVISGLTGAVILKDKI